MLEQDSSLFDDIGEIELSDEFGKIFYKCRYGREWDEKRKLPTYNDLLRSNIDYYYSTKNVDFESKEEKLKEKEFASMSEAKSYTLNSVFQSLRNPYTNVNVVWATRLDYDKFRDALAFVYKQEGQLPGWKKQGYHPWWNKINAEKAISEYPIKPLGE